ncbi:MAG: hypothetical protein Q8O19_07550 [Rectinemataceae bacterium]|jgi:hypothetical protein|nr:hypothetical protein [Rectinemataceae bacterium]
MTSSDAIFRVKLEGPGVAVDKEISQEVAVAIMQVALGGGLPPSGGGDAARDARGAQKNGPRLSLREFLESASARSIPEMMTCFAAYLRDHGGQEEFSREDIKACFKQAGETLPGNFPRDFQKAIHNGWVAEERAGSGRYYLTRKGDEAIKAG